jgi:hypothetical protein
MGKKDPRVDAYIARAGEFARPILTRLRALVHQGCPDVDETIKWSVPAFDYQGPLCGMAAFKSHCIFGFWKAALLKGGTAANQRMRLESVEDLPSDRALITLIRQAAHLNESGIRTARRPARTRPPLDPPPELVAALRRNARARAAFEAFPPSHKREYIEWIADAKTDETRRRRLDTAVLWIAEGKQRNWKYQRK